MQEIAVHRLRLDAFKKWLMRHNSIILDSRDASEVLRFSTRKGDGVIQRKKGGQSYLVNPEARTAVKCFMKRQDWRGPVQRKRMTPDVHRSLVTFLAERDYGLVCAYCGKPLSVRSATIEHLIPIKMGGPDIPANMLLACYRCNQAAGSLSPVNKVAALQKRYRKEKGMNKYGVDAKELDKNRRKGAAEAIKARELIEKVERKEGSGKEEDRQEEKEE